MNKILESMPSNAVPLYVPGRPISPTRIEIRLEHAPSVTVGSWDVIWELSYYTEPEYESEYFGTHCWQYQVEAGKYFISIDRRGGVSKVTSRHLQTWRREWFLREDDHPTIPELTAGTIDMDPGSVTETPIFRSAVRDHNRKIVEIRVEA